MKKNQIRKIKAEKYFRSFELKRDGIDEEARTVELAFSSEDPYRRWWGVEILGHDKGEVDLTRLENSAPVLSDHDHRTQIGVVLPGTVKIGTDKKGRLVAKFGKSKKAKEEFQDVLDGIRTKVSVGYSIEKMVLESEEDGVETYRVTRWQPYEVSLVSVPADDTVGVGKSHEGHLPKNVEIEVKKMPPEETEKGQVTTGTTEPRIDVAAERENAAKEARDGVIKTINDMNDLASKFKSKGYDGPAIDAIVTEHIQRGSSFADFKEDFLIKMQDEFIKQRDVDNLDMPKKEAKQYSLFRAITAQLSGDWSKAGFEKECNLAIMEKSGSAPHGFFVPLDVQRALNTGVAAEGGDLVGIEHMSSMFFDQLKDSSVALSLGATTLGGLDENVDIPQKTGAASVFWLGEDEDTTDSEPTFGHIELRPKTISTSVPMTRRMLKQSLPAVEGIVLQDMAQEMALGIDIKAFEGDGTGNTPVGIRNTVGVNVQTLAAPGAPTWAELVGMETQIATDNALTNGMNIVCTAAVRGNLKTTKKDAGSGIFLMENGTANGYPVTVKNALAANSIIQGHFPDLLVGYWGVLDVRADRAEKAKSDGLVLRMFQDLDLVVRYPERFCITNLV